MPGIFLSKPGDDRTWLTIQDKSGAFILAMVMPGMEHMNTLWDCLCTMGLLSRDKTGEPEGKTDFWYPGEIPPTH